MPSSEPDYVEYQVIWVRPRWWRPLAPVGIAAALSVVLLARSELDRPTAAAPRTHAAARLPMVKAAAMPVRAPASAPSAFVPRATPAPPAKRRTAMSPRPPVPPTSPTADAVTTQYQRVGHELADLEAKRGADHCADLADSFHEIHLADALATAEGRGDATAALTELHDRIVRWRGVQISADCLANPLAQDCQ